MSIMLHYVKHLRRVNGVGWRVMNNHLQIKMTGVNLKHHQIQLINNNLTNRSYATRERYEFDYSPSNTGLLNSFEAQLKRIGRTTIFDIRKVLREVQTTEVMSSLTALLLIRSCGRPLFDIDNAESINLVKEIWRQIVQMKVPIDVSHYNALLSVYLDKEHVYDVMEFIERMKQDSIAPNRITYQKFIASYCQRGNIEGATKILELMKENEIPLCENVFNSLITGHSQANNLESAVGILEMMKNAEIEPSIFTYEALLCAYAKHGNMDAIKTTLREINESDMNLHSTQLAEIYYVLLANRYTDQAKEFLHTYIDTIQSDIDVARISVKLINIQQIPSAMDFIEKTSKDKTRRFIRAMFAVRALAKNPNSPLQELVKLCVCLHNNPGDHDGGHPFQVATFYALKTHSEPSFTCSLMKEWKEVGGEIRTHYFWPLLVAQIQKNNYDGMINILKIMIQDFNLIPCTATLRDYILPFMLAGWGSTIVELTALKIPREVVFVAIVDRLLMEKKLHGACMFMNLYPAKYPSNKFLHGLVEAFCLRNNAKSFLIALRLLDREIDDDINKETAVELIDTAVLELTKIIPHFQFSLMINFLNELLTAGMSISPEVNEQVKNILEHNVTPEIVEILDKLSSGTLTQVPMTEYNTFKQTEFLQSNERHSGQIELRQQFTKYWALNDTEGILQTLKKMKSIGYRSGPVWAQAVEHFCDVNNLEAATCCVDQIKSSLTMTLDPTKILKYSMLLINNDRAEDAIKFISEQSRLDDNVKLSRGVILTMRNLIHCLMEKLSDEKMIEILTILKSKNYSSVDTNLLNPVVKHHLDTGDLNRAFKIFQHACTDFGCTPRKNHFMKLLIMNEDAELLQKVTDLCVDVHGESNALIDLAFEFLKCERLHQAQKILDKIQIPVHNNKISSFIDYSMKIRRYDLIDNLAKLLKTIRNINHKSVYCSLLQAYININDWERGLALWSDMQELDIHPDARFLTELSELLMRNNQIVPFHAPDKEDIHSVLSNNLTVLRRYFDNEIMQKNYKAAEDIITKMQPSRYDASGMYGRIITSAIKDNDIDTAIHYTETVIHKGYEMFLKNFSHLVDKLIEAQRYADFHALGNLMSDKLKMSLQYNKYKSRVEIETMGLKAYLESFKLDKSLTNSNLQFQIDLVAIVEHLLQHENLLPSVEQWADKLSKAGLPRSLQVLWCYHFIKNSPEAKRLWDNYISHQGWILIAPIVTYLKTNNASDTSRRLMELSQDGPMAGRIIKSHLTHIKKAMNNSMHKSNKKSELTTDSIDLVNSDETLSEKFDADTDTASDEKKNCESSAVNL